jgi:transposase InsO family protein
MIDDFRMHLAGLIATRDDPEQGIRCLMSRKGDCWDNAPTESLWGSLKVGRLRPSQGG